MSWLKRENKASCKKINLKENNKSNKEGKEEEEESEEEVEVEEREMKINMKMSDEQMKNEYLKIKLTVMIFSGFFVWNWKRKWVWKSRFFW